VKITKTKVALFAVAISSVVSFGEALAGTCHLRQTSSMLAVNGKTKEVLTQQASNTWNDWIWRGKDYSVECPKRGSTGCGQTKSVSKTTGYQWNIGGEISAGAIPIIGGALKWLGLEGSYGQNKSITTRFDSNITVSPGWGMYPVQFIKRRWVGGVLQGADVRDSRTRCSVGIADPTGNWWYNWDGGRRFGSWSTNREVARGDTWYTYQL
jgi:hypothetical protein